MGDDDPRGAAHQHGVVPLPDAPLQHGVVEGQEMAGGRRIAVMVGAAQGDVGQGAPEVTADRPDAVLDGPHRHLVRDDVLQVIHGPAAGVQGPLEIGGEMLVALALQAARLGDQDAAGAAPRGAGMAVMVVPALR